MSTQSCPFSLSLIFSAADQSRSGVITVICQFLFDLFDWQHGAQQHNIDPVFELPLAERDVRGVRWKSSKKAISQDKDTD